MIPADTVAIDEPPGRQRYQVVPDCIVILDSELPLYIPGSGRESLFQDIGLHVIQDRPLPLGRLIPA